MTQPEKLSPADSSSASSTSGTDPVWLLILGAWIVATGSVLGSLFFSEIMELAPCSLCWYQRCFMFPVAIVLLVGVLASDKRCLLYALPLTIGGWLFAAYHVLVHVGIIPKSATPCQQGVSCTDIQFELFGFASIPVLSLVSFTAITALLVLARKKQSNG